GAALDRLGTAVAETVMNAAEHGNGGSPDVPVEVAVFRTAAGFRVDVSDSARTSTGSSRMQTTRTSI
ncbi:MAG TPA: ATP-binding protein, partial [Actinomycetes bacterium]|nr:ATP-binding protein [Actinomycetes bacterium]